jgi:segregation and condensation protein B
MENLSAVLEALILSSESPLPLEKICAALGSGDKEEIKSALDRLITEYDERESGIGIQEVAGGFQFRTRPEMASWIKKLKGVKPASLSPAAMETLAIVAYRQPIVKSEIESIRGVDVSAPLKGLLDKKLVRILGRKDVPGKPIIYGTTKKFLEVFNLRELSDLPTMRELRELTEPQESPEQEAISFEDLLPETPAGEMPKAPETPSGPEAKQAELPPEEDPAADAEEQEEHGVEPNPGDDAV